MSTAIATREIDIAGYKQQLVESVDFQFTDKLEIEIEGDSTNVELPFESAIQSEAPKVVWIECDRDITLKTNSSTDPDDTLDIKAGKPLLWTEDCYLALPFSADISALFVTLEAGDPANLVIVFGFSDSA